MKVCTKTPTTLPFWQALLLFIALIFLPAAPASAQGTSAQDSARQAAEQAPQVVAPAQKPVPSGGTPAVQSPEKQTPSTTAPTVSQPEQSSAACVPDPRLPLSCKTIMLDAGHGGRQGGAVRNKVDEKTITLSVALKLADELRAQGATVIMTRTTDLEVTLEDRVDLSNRVKPDIFLSIHVNANTDPFIHGVETYYYTNDGAVLADDLLQSLSSDLGEQSNWYRWEELYVLHYNSQVAALAEIGYLSNAPSFKNLVRDDYQKKVADALDTGILNYFKAVPKAPAPAIVPPPDTRPKPLSKDEMF